MNINRTCILILGMHRSETNAITRVLNLLGAALPKTLIPDQQENSAGFGGSQAFMNVNDALLAEAGSRWDNWNIAGENVLAPDRIAAFEAQIAEAINKELGVAPVIVLKDPRIARLLPLYLRVLRSIGFDVRCVHITRSPAEVAQSLTRRNELSVAFSELLWSRHTLDAEQASRTCDRVFVTYQELMSDDGIAIQRLAEWGTNFGMSADRSSLETAAGHLQRRLRHFDDGEEQLAQADNPQSRFLATTYQAIISLGPDSMQPVVLAVLDSCYARLNQAAQLDRARSPLVSLRDNIKYQVSLKISKVLEKAMPATSRRFRRSAAKRDPRCLITDDGKGTPTLLLPFTSALAHARPPMRIAVILHVYYLDQVAFFLNALKSISAPFSLFISTDTNEKAEFLRKAFAGGAAKNTEVRVMPNRGRDIAPKLVGFADVYDSQDLLLFLHTKSSKHSKKLDGWCDYLVRALLGSHQTVESILDAFAVAPELGIVAPPNLATIRSNIKWGRNYENARALAERMGIVISTDSPIFFPAGSMFWARPAAIQPLLDANIQLEDFPDEAGQKDATFAHAVERLFFYSCEVAGLRWIHAGLPDQLANADSPLTIKTRLDLELALSNQRPTLLSGNPMSDVGQD